MILGVGTDLVEVSSFAEQLEDSASYFVEGTFTLGERREAESRPSNRPDRHLAVRFAAKEALIKAWSSAMWGHPPVRQHVNLREIEVVTDAYHRPTLRLHGDVAQAMQDFAPLRIHLSLSHDGNYATAFVVLEKLEGQ